MAKVKIYGALPSRALRILWMAEEIGLDYEHVPIDFRAGEAKTDAYKAINPIQKIPAIDDDGFVVFESMAINLYLAKKYGPDLWPETLEDQTRCIQWSIWVMAEVEQTMLDYLNHAALWPEDRRDPSIPPAAAEKLQRPLQALETAIGAKPYVLGDRFMMIDLSLASVFMWGRRARFDFSPFPNIDGWLKRATDRPALKRALSMNP